LHDSSGDETFTPASPYQFTAADNGSHTFATKFSIVEPETVTVTDTGTPAITGTESINLGALLGAPAQLIAGSPPDSIPIGFPFPQPVTATVEDSNFNPLPGITVTFTIMAASNGASGTFAGGVTTIPVVTDANGVASATLTANSIAGSFTVTATSGSLPGQQLTLTSTTNVPATITIAFGNRQTGPIDTQFTQKIAVNVFDTQGNPVPEVPVVFSAPASGPSIYLPVTTSVTLDQNSGSPGFADLVPVGVANSIPGSYLVTATAGNASVQFNFTNTSPAATPGYLFAAGGTSKMAAINMQFATPLAVQPYDALNGHCISQVPITFSAPASGPGATFSAATSISDPVNCTAQVTATSNGIAGGPYTVTATAPNGVSTTFTLTNLTGTTALLATGGTPQAAVIGHPFGSTLQATLLDGHGNPMSCQTVSFSAPASGASAILSPPATTTDANGVAQVMATANGTAGSYSVTATSGAFSVPFSLTNVLPVASKVGAVSGSPQSATVGTQFALPLTAIVLDNQTPADPVPGVTVTFVLPFNGPSATLSSLTAVTNAQGMASVTATADGTVGSYYVSAFVGQLNSAFALTNIGGSLARLVTDGTPQFALLGTEFAQALQVTLRDASGNPLNGVPVSFTAPTSGANATLSAASPVTDNYGVATVIATANNVAGSYTVTIKAGSLSANFSLTNAAFSPCDVNQDTRIDILDVQQMINEALGKLAPGNDLNGDHVVNSVDVQIVLDAANNLGCSAS
jgi:hypothetical protein